MKLASRRWILFSFALAGVFGGAFPGVLVPAFAAGDDLDSIPLIDVQHYNPSQSSTSARISKGILSAIITSTADGYVRSEIENAIRDEVGGSAEIRDYFSSSERTALVQRLLRGVSQHLSESHNDADFVAALSYLGNDLIGSVVERAMQKEGVDRAETRAAWRVKLLSEFNRCTTAALTLLEASDCLDSVKAGLPHNLGLALMHAMTRDQLAPALNDPSDRRTLERDLDRRYRSCVGASEEDAGSVKPCVIDAMRTGTLSVSDISLKQKLKKVFPAPDTRALSGAQLREAQKQAEQARQSQNAVRADVWAGYMVCVGQKSDSTGFYSCIDDLTIKAGGAAAEQKILTESAVISAIPDLQARANLAAEQRASFERCGSEERAKRVQKDASLSIERCQNLVENRVTLTVLQRSFETSADENIGAGDPAKKRILDQVNGHLKACWSDDLTEEKRQACVRAGVTELAQKLTARVLEQKVPAEVFQDHKGWKESLLSEYNGCLDRNLPADIVHSPARDEVLNRCSGTLRKKAALVAAKYQLLAGFHGKLADDQLKTLVDSQMKNFTSCLGETPNGATLDSCSTTLTHDAAKYAGHIILPVELGKVIKTSSKPVSAKAKAELDDFTRKTVQALDRCLDAKVVKQGAESASKDAESCFKIASHDSALFVGKMQFDWETADYYVGQEKKWNALRADFVDYLGSCIEGHISRDASLDDYMIHIHECGDKTSLRVTEKVGTDQVDAGLANHLTDSGTVDMENERNDLRRKLVGDFKGCLVEVQPGDNASRVACAEALKRSATEAIGLAVGRARVASQLGAKPRPEIQKIEADLHSCAAAADAGDKLSSGLDSCMKKYTLSLASAVGDAKLKATMASTLGSREYANALPDVGKALADYRSCLDQLSAPPLGKDFMSGLDACVANLTGRARGIVQSRVRDWFGNPTGSDSSSNARKLLIDAIPCLDGLMASSPEGDVQNAGVDAEGTLQAMVSLLRNYIDYDSAKAQGDVKVMLSSLQKDLQSIGPDEARKDLVRLLDERHVLDQVIKSMVRSEAGNSLSSLPEDQKFSKAVMEQLTKKDVFDKIFSGPQGQQIMRKAMDEIVRPSLVDGKSMQDPVIVKAKDSLTREIKNTLADSPDFGTVVIQAAVQKQMDDLDAISRFFARILYGKDSLDWSKARLKPQGHAAEEYIRENILRPQMQGDPIAPGELKARMKKAKELVTQAATG